ncbi:GntR family transcriptional regulator [Xylocopilactobacillus apicola]|uniref:GntR family transcriptional regulator n=1 Tax=Xylocopilactobacillus apicola TaxID=2932184 RepID=A0AAU9D0N3_9LACO|nr:GntR family transcriptional regulator [Xylocopilactobacillus apicola]BDR58251.1 GntR family transcriptional regulator [Xylocopilactobacillus apicola]
MKSGILYKEIASSIKKDLLNGKYPVGTLIPSENELETKFDVSKITIRNAIQLLETEGFLEKKQGIGTMVISDRLFNKLSKADSFTSILQKSGKKIEKEVLSIENIEPKEFADVNHRITKIERVYCLDGVPYIYFTHFILFTDHLSEFKNINQKSLYSVIKEMGENIGSFKDSFKAIHLDSKNKRILKTDLDLGIQRERCSYNSAGELIEFSRSIYLTDLNDYKIDYEI